ncbi:MAG: hypothetical protein ACU0CA_15860 [Paracoccaceae bacterium]
MNFGKKFAPLVLIGAFLVVGFESSGAGFSGSTVATFKFAPNANLYISSDKKAEIYSKTTGKNYGVALAGKPLRIGHPNRFINSKGQLVDLICARADGFEPKCLSSKQIKRTRKMLSAIAPDSNGYVAAKELTLSLTPTKRKRN